MRADETKLDILVNNSGTTFGAPFDKYPDVAFDRVFRLNVTAPFALTQAFMPLLRSAARPDDPARIINIGSIAGGWCYERVGAAAVLLECCRVQASHRSLCRRLRTTQAR